MSVSSKSPLELSRAEGHDDRLMYELWLSQWLFPSLIAADELGIIDSLNKRPSSADDLARELQVNSLGVGTLCDLLVNLGFLAKTADGFYNVEPYGNSFLSSTSDLTWGPILRPLREGENARKIVDSIKKGGCHISSDGQTFTEMWEAGDVTEEAARYFIPRMHCLILPTMRRIVNDKHFGESNSILDVGGGSAALGVALAEAQRPCKYTIFELPIVCGIAEEFLKAVNASNYVLHHGSFFTDPWPDSQDTVFLSNILHDWSPAVAKSLIEKSFAATAPGGKIMLQEMIMNEDKTGPMIPLLFSLLMFINHTAQQFTQSELFLMLEDAGFVNPVVTNSSGYYSIVCANKPSE
jgi:acetylserotonin N-methyltransferase